MLHGVAFLLTLVSSYTPFLNMALLRCYGCATAGHLNCAICGKWSQVSL